MNIKEIIKEVRDCNNATDFYMKYKDKVINEIESLQEEVKQLQKENELLKDSAKELQEDCIRMSKELIVYKTLLEERELTEWEKMYGVIK